MVPDVRVISMIPPQTVAAASTTTCRLDTQGYDYATISVTGGATATDTLLMTFVQISESETTPTAYTDGTVIVPFVGGTATSATAGFVLPGQSSSTVIPIGSTFQFNADLTRRKRFLIVLVTPANTMALGVHAVMSRAQNGPAAQAEAAYTNSTRSSLVVVNQSA